MYQRQWTTLVLWFAVVLSVVGQSSNVTECISSYAWSINSLNQTPCLVAAYLQAPCGTITSVNSIPVDNHYLAPTLAQANLCECSSVTYSMISACAGCQDRTFLNWTTWSENCMSTTVTTYPQTIPSQVEVPSWAYLNVSLTDNDFSEEAAQLNANSSNTSTSISSSATTAAATSFTLTPSASSIASSPSTSHSNAGAIAGGVVGGLVCLVIIALGMLWFYLRKKKNMVQKDVTFDRQALVSGQPVSQQTTGPNGPSPLPQSIYTSEMSSYPGSPLTTSGVFTTIPPSRRSLESVSLSVAQFGGGPQVHHAGQAPRGYTGIPEV